MRLQHLLSIVLTLVLAALLVWVTDRYSASFDWTAGNRASLTQASQRVLDAMPEPIRFEAFASPGPARQDIRLQIERYQRVRDDIDLEFVDPALAPRRLRELGVNQDGEVRVFYRGRNEPLQDLSERNITQALQRLSGSGDQWVVFVSGHGERDPLGRNDGDYGTLSDALKAQGLKPRELTLAESPAIPDNAALLVLASPQSSLLPGEVQIIRHYLAAGGNLLWLDDPGPRVGLGPLAAALGLQWRSGTAIYPDFRELGTGHPAVALVVGYPPHPITQRLTGITLFPFAAGLEARSDSDWNSAPLLRTPPRSWLETGDLSGAEVVFDEADGDAAGPITLGMALERRRAAPATANDTDRPGTQRAVVIGDSDFLTNANLNAQGNRALGLSIFQWLAERDAQIAVDVPRAPDASLQLPPWQGQLVWMVFVVLLPPALLGIGLLRWWLRRRR